MNSTLHYALIVALTFVLGACSVSQTKLPSPEIAATSQPPSRERTIALLGGTGMVGGYILQEALAQGYAVRSMGCWCAAP